MSEPQIAAEIIQHVVRNRPAGYDQVTAETRLLEDGVIDSLGLLDLVAFVEEKYGVYVDDFEVDLDNFGSAQAVERFVRSKL